MRLRPGLPAAFGALLLALLGCATFAAAQDPDLYDMTKVRTLHLTFKQSTWWNLLVANKSSRTDIKADLAVDGKTYRDVGVRFRGNTSYSYNPTSQKKPFNILTDAFVPGQRLYGYKNLNLLNSYKDATFVREVIAYETMRRYVPALKANFVKLVINNQNWGIYVNVEQPNAGFVGDWFRNTDGNLYRGDSERRNTRPTLTYLGTNPALYQAQYDIKVANQSPWLDLIKLCDKLNNTTAAQRPVELPKVLNIDNALWYLALQNIFSNTDSYLGTGNDYLAYHDVYHDRFLIMPWDLNTTWGGYDWRRLLGAQGLKTMSPYYKGASYDKRPLITELLTIPRWRKRYLAHFRTMLDEFFKWEVLGPVVAKYQTLIEAEVKADTKKLYATQLFYDNATKDVVVTDRYGKYTIPGLKAFVDTRRAYLLAHADIKKPAPVLSALGHQPDRPGPVDVAWVTARVTGSVPVGAVTLYHRAVGPFLETSMFDDGQHHDGQASDGVFGAMIPKQAAGASIQYYVGAASAAAQGGAMTFEPRKATFAPRTYRVSAGAGLRPLKIGEFLARNDTGIRDEQGDRDDWIELVNTGATSVSVGGMWLTDNMNKPKKWAIPTGTSILPGQRLLIWADDEVTEGPLHTSFKLDGDGEEIGLFDADGTTVIDWVAFGAQQKDISTGRVPGFPATWVTFPAPSPRQTNQPVPCGHLQYDGLATAATTRLTGAGTPAVGGTVTYRVSQAAATTPGLLALALAPAQVELTGVGSLLVNPVGMALIPFRTDPSGLAAPALGIPKVPALAGRTFYFQALIQSGTHGVISNAVMTTLCR